MERKLPIGIQGFEKLRTEGFLYVDKTEYIYRLAHTNVPYFLSRPRRFGKSLLLSAMRAYWEGKRELFRGLKIEVLEEKNQDAWQAYPVFYFDFNGANYREEGALESLLDEQLRRWEGDFALSGAGAGLGERFRSLLIAAKKQTGRCAVVLVDEYDKPLLDTVEDPVLQTHNRDVFRGFFSTLKSFDEYIQFLFITGVSKFHKVSIFSDLNQLNDISLNEDYAQLCGICQDEITKYFAVEVEALAKRRGLTTAECLQALKAQYDGYRFHADSEGVYNPYSLLRAFYEKDFGAYWFETGTPTFLVKRLRDERFDPRKLTDRTIYAGESTLKDYTGDSLKLVPLLYQTGYLTIADYDPRLKRYTLCFPNDEVKYGFLESLMPAYVPAAVEGTGLDIFSLEAYVEEGRLDDIRNVLIALFAGIPYTQEADPFEHYFQAVIYLVFTLLGKFVLCEMHTFSGRIDCRVETRNYIYLFEFKRDDTPEHALAQIDTKEYALPFLADHRVLYKIGATFDSTTRRMDGWTVQEDRKG